MKTNPPPSNPLLTNLSCQKRIGRLGCWFSVVLAGSAMFANGQSVLDLPYNPVVGVSSEGGDWTYVSALSIQSGRRLIVGGHFSTFGAGNNANYVGSYGRLLESGAAEVNGRFVSYPEKPLPTNIPSDSTSDPWVWSNFMSADHEMLAVGNFGEISGEIRRANAFLFQKDGSTVYYNKPMEIEHPTSPVIFWGGHILPDGEPLYYGFWATADGVPLPSFARQIGSDGEFVADPSYDANFDGDAVITSVTRLPDGKMYVCGSFTTVGGVVRTGLVRLHANATLDTSFNYSSITGSVASPSFTLLQPDGSLLVAGSSVMRITPAGTKDASFGITGLGLLSGRVVAAGIRSMVLRADGNIIIGGFFTSVEGKNGIFPRNGVAMLDSVGNVITDFDPNVALLDFDGNASGYPPVRALALQEDGKVIIGGEFSKVSGVTRKGLARMTADTPAVSDFVISPDRMTLTWTRMGSAPEIFDTKFQVSTNAGVSYTTLAAPTYTPGVGWQLSVSPAIATGSKLWIRATGLAASGEDNGSTGLVERILKPTADFTLGQPSGLVVIEGDPASFSVVARSSLAITSYQWRRNGVNLVDGPNISGATTNALNLSAAMAADGGTYTVVVRTSAGSVTSAGALLKVIVAPAVITNPVDLVVGKGKPVKFTAKFSGTEPTYQWSGPFPTSATGKTSTTLSFSNAQDVHEGPYTITATNSAGVATTIPATLTVVDPPVVAATNNVIAGLGDAPVLSATVTAEAPSSLKYQWLKVTAAVSGATSATYTMNNVQLSQAGAYSLRATNPAGTATGARGEVAVVDDVNEKTQVQKQTGTAVLTAAAAGNGLSYVWKFTPANLDPPSTISHDGVKYVITGGGKTLTIKGLAVADAGDYVAEVTNVAGMMPTAPEHLFVTTGTPSLVGPLTFTENAMVNAPFSFQVDDGTNDLLKPASYKMTISPALKGLSISKTGLITGRPQKAGDFLITVTATNAHGTSVAISGTLTVEPIPTNAIGKFVAIVDRQAVTNASLGGRLDLTVTPVGSYSGKLFMGALSYSFSGGKLNVNAAGDTNTGTIDNPTNVIAVARKGTTPLTLSFDLDLANNTISGSVTDGVNSADLDGWRLVWSKTANPVLATNYLGRFNFSYETPAEAPAQTYPHGFGTGSALIPNTGIVTVAGIMADGAAFSTASFVGPQGQLAVFKTLYSNTGSVLGTHQINAGTGAVTDYSLPSAFSWLKKDQAPKVVYSYGSGFGPVTLTVDGSRYDPLLITSAVNVLGSDVLTQDTKLDFEDAGLGAASIDPDVTFTLSAANKATFTTNNGKVTLTVTKSTGRFSGTITLLDDIDPGPATVNVKRTGRYSGLVIRNLAGTAGTGRGYLLLSQLPVLPTTSTAKTPILSGPVVLSDVTP